MDSVEETQSVFKAAIQASQRGWAAIPLKPGTKTPVVRFKTWTRPPNEKAVTKWFDGRDRGVGVVLGRPSRGLCVRDFDTTEAFLEWRDNHSTLADTAPRSKTSRGYHIFFYANERDVQAASVTGSRTIHGLDGELKANGIAVLPPSLHKTGISYTWEIPPSEEVPFVADIRAAGLVPPPKPRKASSACQGEGFHNQSLRGPCPPIREILEDFSWNEDGATQVGELDPRILEAIQLTRPVQPGERNQQIFQYVRRLYGIPGLQDLPLSELHPYASAWFSAAYPNIRTRKFEETWKDFVVAWHRVERPNEESIETIFARTTGTRRERLIHLCALLQEIAGAEPFYLDCRTVKKLFDVSHTTGNKWLNNLLKEGVLILASPHQFEFGQKGQARKFFYNG